MIDAGANVGQFSRAMAEYFPGVAIIAFEALPDVAETLRANMSDYSHVTVVPKALGDEDGELTFHRASYSLASSALALADGHREHFPGVDEQGTIRVPVGRLDTLLADTALEPPVLLKLDLQGYELTALRGAKETLKRVDYLLLEASFEPMYEDEPLFGEVYDYLRAEGFEVVRPLAVLEGRGGVIVQMDALFRRR